MRTNTEIRFYFGSRTITLPAGLKAIRATNQPGVRYWVQVPLSLCRTLHRKYRMLYCYIGQVGVLAEESEVTA